MSEVILLSNEGVSMKLKSNSVFSPEGEIFEVEMDGKGLVTTYVNGKEGYTFEPNHWFGGKPDNK